MKHIRSVTVFVLLAIILFACFNGTAKASETKPLDLTYRPDGQVTLAQVIEARDGVSRPTESVVIGGPTCKEYPHKWTLVSLNGSWHNNPETRKKAEQVNPGIGVEYTVNKNLYLGTLHVYRNSTGEETDSVYIGVHAEVARVLGCPLKFGAQAMHMRYVAKKETKTTTYKGRLMIPTASWGSSDFTVFVGVFLAERDTVVVFGTKFAL